MSKSPYAAMNCEVFAGKITSLLDGLSSMGAYQIAEESKLGLVVRVDSEDVFAILAALRQDSELQFEQLIDVFGADVRESIEVTYRLRSLVNNIDLIIKTELPYAGVYLSVGELYAAAWMPERELCEMFGLSLLDHPNPKRLLTMDGMPPFLRKEVGIRTKEEIWGSS